MTLRLCTVDGTLVTPAWDGPRWVCLGGELLNYARPHDRPTIPEGRTLLGQLHRDAWEAREAGKDEVARMIAREAIELFHAIEAAERAAPVVGYRAFKPTQKVTG